ncbi:MAG: gliding motility-associated C-terminal domain-containing protein [Bacteroidota bacterium]
MTRAQTKSYNLLPDTIVICIGDSVLLKFPEEIVSPGATYEWTSPRMIYQNTKQLYVKIKGKYLVKIYDGNRIIHDTTFVKVNDKPKFNIRDTMICSGNILIIKPDTKYKYSWGSGDPAESLKIEKPGKYWIKLNNKGCFYTDTFRVNSANGVMPNFGKEILVCETDNNKILSVKAPADTKLYWNTGENTTAINATKEGVYWVKSTSRNCGVKTDSVNVKYKNCDCDMYIPNSFTPNDDDRNDVFAPSFQCDYSYFLLTIYDRWGNTVYTSNNVNGKWDGKFKSNPCPDDVYVYKIEAVQRNPEKKISRSGHISLFR